MTSQKAQRGLGSHRIGSGSLHSGAHGVTAPWKVTTMSIRRHTSYNLAGAVVSIGAALITVPLYIKLLGEARYGVLAIAWLFIGYFGTLDLGLGRAVAQRVASEVDQGSKQVGETLWTALAINVAAGIFGALFIAPIGLYLVHHWLVVEPELKEEITAALPYFVAVVPLFIVSGVLNGALQGLSRFGLLNVLVSIGALAGQVIPLLSAVLIAPQLQVVILAAVITRILVLIGLLSGCLTNLEKPFPPTFAKSKAIALLKFGGWVTVSSIIGPIMVVFDRLVIGAVMGTRAVSYYTVPFQLAERLAILPSAFGSALFPKFANGDDGVHKLLGTSFSAVIVIMTPVTCVALLLLDPFLTYWINPEFAKMSSMPGKILIFAFWFNSIALIPFTFLQATHRPDLVAKFHIVELCPYIIFLFLLIYHFGLSGAAFAFLLRVSLDLVLLARSANSLRLLISIGVLPFGILISAFGGAWFFSFRDPVYWTFSSLILLAAALWSLKSMPGEIFRAIASLIRRAENSD